MKVAFMIVTVICGVYGLHEMLKKYGSVNRND